MRRADWTPAVLITASVSLTVVVILFVTSPWMRGPFGDDVGPAVARHSLPDRIDVWVGDIAPGLLAVLGPVWGEEGPDRAHDQSLNELLTFEADEVAAWYQLLLFNTSEEGRSMPLADGALVVRTKKEGLVASLVSVAGLLERGEASVPPALRAVLAPRGTLADSVEVPAGMMADLLVAFDRRVALGEASAVGSAQGTEFRRRPISRRDFEALLEHPDVRNLEDL